LEPYYFCAGKQSHYARTFPQDAPPKEEVEGLLKDISGRTAAKKTADCRTVFVAVGDQSLSRYERAFYQFSIELVPGRRGRNDCSPHCKNHSLGTPDIAIPSKIRLPGAAFEWQARIGSA